MEYVSEALQGIHNTVTALKPGERVDGAVPNAYYEEDLNPENFTGVDAVILDESVVIDILEKKTRRRYINGIRDDLSSGYKTLELLDEITRRNRLESDELEIYYVAENCRNHPNGTEPGTIGRHLLTSIYEKLDDVGTELDLSEVTDPVPEKWQSYGEENEDLSEDWKIGQLAEAYNGMVVATDTDFQTISQDYDFVAMPPDLAELGFRAANDRLEDAGASVYEPL